MHIKKIIIFEKKKRKKSDDGAREMAQQLRVLASFAEHPSSASTSTWWPLLREPVGDVCCQGAEVNQEREAEDPGAGFSLEGERERRSLNSRGDKILVTLRPGEQPFQLD